MVRKLASTWLSLLLVLPSAAFALGLGDIRLSSALNQPMKAEVELLSVTPKDADAITADLAPYDVFARVGLDRPAVLMYLKFHVVARGDRHFIEITSQEPIREPFLDFLLEVTWPSGRLLREYTVLIDPPGMGHEAPPTGQAPVAGTAGPATAPAMAQPAAATAAPSAAMAPATPMAEPTEGAAAQPAAAPMASGGLRYGPVRADETLWSIAHRMKPNRSVSTQQVMMALLKANPDAFYDNNVNRLKKGYVLRLDDPALINAMTQAEAVRAIGQQNRAWQDYVKQAGATAAERPSTETSPQAASAVAAPEEPHLKLVAPEAAGKKGAGTAAAGAAGSPDQLRQQLALAQENAEAQQRENEELRGRMKELEEQVASMKRLLELKDSDLAAVQQQMGTAAGAAKPAAPAVEPAKPAAEMAASAAKPAAEMPAPTAPAAEEAAKPEAQTPVAAPEAAKPAEAAAPEAEAAKPAQPAKPKPKAKRPAPPPMPIEEPSLLDGLMANPLVLAGGGGFLVIILVLVGLMIKRRRSGGPGFSESILTAGGGSVLSSRAVAGAPSEESSLFSDLAVSGMNSVQGAEAEVDPLTEADVYMAYGRYQQAEDLLKEALKKEAGRHDLQVKLAEVYYSTKDRAKFEALASDLFTALEGTGPLWAKMLTMGHELSPDNPMFSEAPAEGGEHAGGEFEAAPEVLDIGIDLDALAEDMESSAEGGETPFGLDLGVDFSDLDEGAAAPAAAPAQTPAEAEGMEFDLGNFEEALAETAPATETPAAPEDALGGLDLDFGNAPELTEEVAAPEPAPVEAGGLDFDLGDLNFGEEAAEAPQAEAVAEPPPEEASAELGGLGDFDLGGLSLDADEPSAAGGNGNDLGDLSDLGLGDLDAVGTKLDLAKAYVDMGEPDSARSILDEVMSEGNDAQKRQAQDLMAQLS